MSSEHHNGADVGHGRTTDQGAASTVLTLTNDERDLIRWIGQLDVYMSTGDGVSQNAAGVRKAIADLTAALVFLDAGDAGTLCVTGVVEERIRRMRAERIETLEAERHTLANLDPRDEADQEDYEISVAAVTERIADVERMISVCTSILNRVAVEA